MKSLLLAFALLMLSAIAQAEQVIELVPLRSELPQNIIPVIQPLLGSNGSVSSMHNQLILKVDKSQLPEIKRLISQLDRPPQRLLIEVSHEGNLQGQLSGYDVQGRLSNRGNSEIRANIKHRQTQNQFDASQMVQATEGYPALISYGKIVPYQDYDIEFGRRHFRSQQYTTFQDATSGFYVIPRLNGDRVTLEIEQQRKRYQPHDGSIAVQGTSTFVHGRLGEWISLGSISDSSSQRGSGLISRRTSNLNQNQQIYVRVTLP